MLRIPVISAIAVSRLAALIVVVFCAYLLLAPAAVLGPGQPAADAWWHDTLRTAATVGTVGAVGLAALYALFRHGRHNGLRYLAFVALLAPALLFLPTVSRSPQWPISLIIMGVLLLAAISCLLPNPIQAWFALEPPRR